jgi:hypothetical protein
MTTTTSDHIVIEKIDVDGDGVPDGELVKHIRNGKVIEQKFVSVTRMKELAEEVFSENNVHDTGPRQRMVYNNPNAVNIENKPVVIQDGTTFGQYVKEGAGHTAGTVGALAVFEGLMSLFTSSEGGGRRVRRRRVPKTPNTK